jgi:DNA primase
VIPPDFIDDLLSRTDVVDVISSRVTLKKTGQNYSGLCPFHTEKSPSFSVNQEKQFYYCFGCQASGSALKFLMEFERLDFVAAVEMLASKAGLEVPSSSPPGTTERLKKRKSIYEILEQSSVLYQGFLRQHESRDIAVSYLKQRGLTGEIARDFQLGYAPAGWDNLMGALAKTNHERDLLIESGMLIDNSEEGKTYDRFRDRVMFPIRDTRGRVIAFGGRIIGDGKPKYLNSPETPVFHKGRELYGLYESRRRNRKLEQLIVVEGYMDVVALAQQGISYAVATLGTATSSDHLDRLFRTVSKLVFSFDGDKAGRAAAWKALQESLAFMRDGRSARFLFLPEGEDPDTLVRKEGKDKFEWRINQAPHLTDFLFDHLQEGLDMSSMEGKATLSQLSMPLIQKIPEGVFKQLVVGKLSELTGLSSEKLTAISDAQPAAAAPFRSAVTSEKSYRHSTSKNEPQTAYRGGAGGLVSTVSARDHQDVASDEEYAEMMAAAEFLDEDPSFSFGAPVSREMVALAEDAIGILLRQPDLAGDVDEKLYSQLENAPGCQLFVDLVHSILAREVASPVVLLASYQDQPEFAVLKSLAEKEQLLDVSDLPQQYQGIVKKLLKTIEVESFQKVRKGLHAKPFAEWSAEERQNYRESLKNKQP